MRLFLVGWGRMGHLMATLAHEKGYLVGGRWADAPSSTAKTLPHLSALHSVRVGKHRLPLSGLYESIEIGHQAWDRRAFAGRPLLGRQLAPQPKCLCQPPPMKNKKGADRFRPAPRKSSAI